MTLLLGEKQLQLSSQTTSQRLYFLDWLRVIAFTMLVLYHVGRYYVTWGWHVMSPYAGTTLQPWMNLSDPWRMSLLFLVSGAATSYMVKGGGAAEQAGTKYLGMAGKGDEAGFQSRLHALVTLRSGFQQVQAGQG